MSQAGHEQTIPLQVTRQGFVDRMPAGEKSAFSLDFKSLNLQKKKSKLITVSGMA